MATKRVLADKDFNRIIVRTHRLARNITMRVKPDGLHVTVPPYSLSSKVMEVVEQYRERLLQDWQRVCKKSIDLDFRIQAPCFRLWLEKGNFTCFSVRNTPPLLDALAEHYGLSYKRVKITGSKGRWGSCSAAGSINLSCYLMLLPSHLMDYVLLHELSHTKEMNHGPRFWELLDSMTEGRAHLLRAELRQFNTDF